MKPDRIGNVICWFIILLAVAWICLVAVPSCVDMVSRHEATWTDGGGRHVTEMVSEKVSDHE